MIDSNAAYKILKLTTKLKGIFGSDEMVGEGGEGGRSSLALMACWSCSYLGPLKYLSNLIFTVGPAFFKNSTA